MIFKVLTSRVPDLVTQSQRGVPRRNFAWNEGGSWENGLDFRMARAELEVGSSWCSACGGVSEMFRLHSIPPSGVCSGLRSLRIPTGSIQYCLCVSAFEDFPRGKVFLDFTRFC